MKRSELINELASKAKLSRKRANEIVKIITEIITKQLAAGEPITIDNLGRFYTVTYKKHDIKSLDGSMLRLEPRLSPRFTPSKKLRESVKATKQTQQH